MKKIFFILAAMFFAWAPLVFSQDAAQTQIIQTTTQQAMYMPASTYPWQVSVQGGGLWPQKNKSRLRDGEEISGRLTYDLTPMMSIGAESGGIRFEDKRDGTKFGHLDGVPLMADLVLKMPIPATEDRLVPYVYGAAGVIFWSYDKSSFSDDTGVEAHERANWAAKPGAGIEYYLNPHVSIFAEASYLFSRRYTLKNGSATPPNGKVDVNSLYGGGGIKIAF